MSNITLVYVVSLSSETNKQQFGNGRRKQNLVEVELKVPQPTWSNGIH